MRSRYRFAPAHPGRSWIPWASLAVALTLATGAAAQTARISVAPDGTQADRGSYSGTAVSADGRVVAFVSHATNLVAGDTNDVSDVFVLDRQTGALGRVSVTSGGAQADGHSAQPALSADGRFVAFESSSTTLVASDTNGKTDVFVRDRTLGITVRVSVSSAGVEGNGDSFGASLSADGRLVVFSSNATNLVPADTNAGTDVFVHDRTTGATARVSVASSGAQAIFDSPGSSRTSSSALSSDGRFVVFTSTAINLTADPLPLCGRYPSPPGPCGSVFVHDRSTATTQLVSVPPDGESAPWRGGIWPSITADGRFVTFASAPQSFPGSTPGRPAQLFSQDVYVHDRQTRRTERVYQSPPTGAFATPEAVISKDGRYVAIADRESKPGVRLLDRVTGDWVRVHGDVAGPPSPGELRWYYLSIGGAEPVVAVISTAVDLVAGDTNDADDVFLVTAVDPDGDAMPTSWELAFGLDPFDPADADGDPDGDGFTNAQEAARHSHPRGLDAATRHFAEGARSALFSTAFSVANPGNTEAAILLRYVDRSGLVASSTARVAARASREITVPAAGVSEFATTLESDVPVVADRLMWWTAEAGYGSHGEHAVASPSSTWYFAEGATHSGFDLFYLLYNPSGVAADVRVRYLRPSGGPVEKTYTVAPGQRFNIWVDYESLPGGATLAETDVSAQIDVLNGVAILAERAMYRTAPGADPASPGVMFEAGHAAAGVTTPATSWYFAEGATGEFFDLFFLLANPGDTAARVRATYLLSDGRTFTKTYSVAASSRFNIWVDLETFDGVAGVPLQDVGALSVTLDVENGVPIVAERAMWWPGPTPSTWTEAHASAGATLTAGRWVAATGDVRDGAARTDSFYLIANPGSTAIEATVTLLFADGTPAESKVFAVAPHSRLTVNARAEFPSSVGRTFGALVEGREGERFVVESAVYRDAMGRYWAAGANALATPLP